MRGAEARGRAAPQDLAADGGPDALPDHGLPDPLYGRGPEEDLLFQSLEGEWEELLLANLRRKASALGWGKERLAALEGARIGPFRVGKQDLRVLEYRGTVIKGWTGLYELDLPEPFFLLAYDSGLGSKNSQGFGMVEVVDAQKA
ncbi:MAG: CRISPR-associated endoribonuclease Cas6 [Candidatus Acetothermia bacterium]|nr:CRISPR-associated endoribonuclease Cas6 [Candidatus Acetothermia bacterium]